MDIDEWSQDSEAFKTITSGSETRNQTTNKKQYDKNYQSAKKRPMSLPNQQSIEQLYKQLNRLQQIRVKKIKQNKYDKLEKINQKIDTVNQKIQKVKQNVAMSMYEERQFEIYEQHQHQMKYFHDLWDDIFQKFKRNQHVHRVKLQVEEDREVRELYQRLEAKKQAIIKRCSKNRQLLFLNKVQNDLLKKQKFEDLAKLQLNKKRRQLKSEIKQRIVNEITSLQQRQLAKLQQKYELKQNSLKMKLKQCKQYELKIFKKNQEKLKQKFMNSINKLQHNQKMIKSRCFSSSK